MIITTKRKDILSHPPDNGYIITYWSKEFDSLFRTQITCQDYMIKLIRYLYYKRKPKMIQTYTWISQEYQVDDMEYNHLPESVLAIDENCLFNLYFTIGTHWKLITELYFNINYKVPIIYLGRS